MISALSVEFLPVVWLNCWMGCTECASSPGFHVASRVDVQSP